MKKMIDLPDVIFISLLFGRLFLLTVGNVELVVVLVFILMGVSILYYVDQKDG
ncbi:hypothetical protein ACWN6Y_05290 [Vagococcus teuberi]|uniref:hypothetical protein n=1 Tax=Vagococcus teuberi TaxID=519472 RepID=UPI0012ECF424|nr:hypothetical protein [Vagococcus teuberi]